MKIIAIIQARMRSERLSGKTLLRLGSKTVLDHVIDRTFASEYVNEVVVATSYHEEDDPIATLCRDKEVPCYRGSMRNVLERFFTVARTYEADHIVRCCGDSPFLDTTLMDRLIKSHLRKKADFSHVSVDRNTIWGVAACVFNFSTLEDTYRSARLALEKEHLNLYMFGHPEKYKTNTVQPYKYMLRPYRVTLDTEEDYSVIKKVYKGLSHLENGISTRDIITYLDGNPEVVKMNSHVEQKYADNKYEKNNSDTTGLK